MKHLETPEIIGRVRSVNSDGEDARHGDKIVGIQVQTDAKLNREGTVQIDVRDFGPKKVNLVIEVSLPELLTAIATAAIHRQEA